MSQLEKITIKGYKSIKELNNFNLHPLNILVGVNGTGKSNFISAFKLLANIYQQHLQLYVQKSGGADTFLHYGRKKTQEIQMEFYFDLNGYRFTLTPTADNRLIFKKETLWFMGFYYGASSKVIGTGHKEALLKSSTHSYAKHIKPTIASWRIYHFHDTSDTAFVKQKHSISDNLRLKSDGANLAAFLSYLRKRHLESYQQIVQAIRLVAPFFDDFVQRNEEEYVQLEWLEKGNPDTPFNAHVLSDGTLRFICLATLLLQPFELMSDTMLIDEPELGLHPYAISILARLIKRAAEKKQLIVSSQSIELINHFSASDIIVVDRERDSSTFKRLSEDKLRSWLEIYSIGDFWQQSIIRGRFSR